MLGERLGWVLLIVGLSGCSSVPLASTAPEATFIGPVFANDGGPLLVLSPHGLSRWKGAPLDDDVGGDYGRAIAAGGLVSQVSAAAEQGVVLGNDEHVSTARWIKADDAWLVVAWIIGDDGSDAKLLAQLSAGRITEWTRLDGDRTVRGELHLLHAASSGADFVGIEPITMAGLSTTCANGPIDRNVVGIGDAVIAPVPAGRYAVEWTKFHIPNEAEALLCRWRPAR